MYEIEERISISAKTEETVEQLTLEVKTLKGLETMELAVRGSGRDTKRVVTVAV